MVAESRDMCEDAQCPGQKGHKGENKRLEEVPGNWGNAVIFRLKAPCESREH